MARLQPDMVLCGGDQIETVEFGLVEQILDLILGKMMVIRKTMAVFASRTWAASSVAEEFARITDCGEGQAILVARNCAGVARLEAEPGESGLAARAAIRIIGSAPLHHPRPPSERIGMADLVDDRRANRACR
jgi:hypothetical protein